jgi:hypothetical protein
MAPITIPYAFDTVSVEAGDNAKCGSPTYSVTVNDIPVTWITVSGNDLQVETSDLNLVGIHTVGVVTSIFGGVDTFSTTFDLELTHPCFSTQISLEIYEVEVSITIGHPSITTSLAY